MDDLHQSGILVDVNTDDLPSPRSQDSSSFHSPLCSPFPATRRDSTWNESLQRVCPSCENNEKVTILRPSAITEFKQNLSEIVDETLTKLLSDQRTSQLLHRVINEYETKKVEKEKQQNKCSFTEPTGSTRSTRSTGSAASTALVCGMIGFISCVIWLVRRNRS